MLGLKEREDKKAAKARPTAETARHYKTVKNPAFVWEKLPTSFLSNAFAWNDDQLVVHLASILALCAYLAGRIKSPSKKDALEKKALLPAGADTPTRHGRRLTTSPNPKYPNPLIIIGPHVLRWQRNWKVATRSFKLITLPAN